ncbi:MAG: cytochrome c3 family protein [Gemmatimonadota bacterium]|jgi:hypothetical protein
MSARRPGTTAPRRPLLLAGVALALALGTGMGAVALEARSPKPSIQPAPQVQGFPHEAHSRLFPLCTGCHEGIPAGDQATYFPSPDVCARCHDGSEMPRVAWDGHRERISNLKFRHDTHAARLERAGDQVPACSACHVPEGQDRMDVSSDIQLGTCWSCHAHRATQHKVDADCATCHVPLADSHFSRQRIEEITPPADHEAGSFLGRDHGRDAAANPTRCATCHTADRCVSCHVDAADRPEIAKVPFAPKDMELPPAVAHYNRPSSHADEGWLNEHGTQASPQACATCHTTEDCRACHVAPTPDAVAALPSREDVVAPGVHITPHAPESHANAFFLKVHGTLAATDQSSCNTCHVERFCVECHDGQSNGGYHPANFVATHAAEAFGRDVECANCHNVQVFCRACHVESGLTSQGRLGPGYHNGQAVWLLRHGQAARQNLESCTSCHKQRDCVQCHGVLGAFKINPHGENFDAERAWARSPRTCTACHIKNPLNGSAP